MSLLPIQIVSFFGIALMTVCLRLIALIFVAIHLAVDLLHFVVDPRLPVERSNAHCIRDESLIFYDGANPLVGVRPVFYRSAFPFF